LIACSSILFTVGVILTLICNTNTTLCAECPSDVTITPDTGPFEPGDVLTCNAAVGYNPTYTWTGTAGDGAVTVSGTGSTYTLPDDFGDFSVTCTANVEQLTTCAGTQQDMVTGTAVGKC